mgnify:CR=1 FL=1|jgi:NAD(P)-dependent dehydrogenase (short-subunit alcohol dehydrogenase family)|tara:strand:- start:426 stop:962 length:537 start_codon:yes stop_codon:yes gene_type:complete
MKIAITGHSKGIGKALFEELSTEHEVEGFSRSNGFDIQQTNMIVRAVKGSDVFVNNAFNGFNQTELLKEVFNIWRDDKSKTIVNIVSRSKYFRVGTTRSDEYCMQKRGLSDMAEVFQFLEKKKCRIININPGYVRTEMVSDLSEDIDMLTPEECAGLIAWAINQPQHIEVGELSLWRP